jgi:hypothetical protein
MSKRVSSPDASPDATPAKKAKATPPSRFATPRSARSTGSFDDDAPNLEEILATKQAIRAKYALYDTLLVWAWCNDFDGTKVTPAMKDPTRPDLLLEHIFEHHSLYQLPAAGAEVEQMRRVAQFKPTPKRRPGALGLSAAQANKLGILETGDEDDNDDAMEVDAPGVPPALPMAPLPSSAALHLSRSFPALPPHDVCLCCFARRDPSVSPGANSTAGYMWMCFQCKRYGSESIAGPNNTVILTLAAKSSAPATAALSSSSSVTTSGPSHSTTLTLAEAHERRCASYLAALGEFALNHYPPFTGGSALERADLAHQAIRAMGEALDRRIFITPSRNLRVLIQSGMLVDVSLAVPMSSVNGAMPASKITDFGSVQLLIPGGAPGVESALPTITTWTFEQFGLALTTIVPCLAAQPNAIQEWMRLYATAQAMSLRYNSWDVARRYVNDLLTLRTAARASFSPVDRDLMDAIVQSTKSQPPTSSGGLHPLRPSRQPSPALKEGPPARKEVAPARAPTKDEICFAWQGEQGKSGYPTTCRSPCPNGRRHECRYCNATSHPGSKCASRDTPLKREEKP